MPTTILSRDISACPLCLPDGNYEFPHLIIPTNRSDTALGMSYFAEVSPNNCATSFNFDIPTSRTNQQCTVYFSLPRHDQLVTSNFKWDGAKTGTEGPGSLRLVQYKYNTGVNIATTGNNEPPLGPDPPVNLDKVAPGNSYKVWSGSCGPGGVMSWRLSSTDSSLLYFQDWNPCAIGLWIVYEKSAAPGLPECGHCPSQKNFESHAAWIQQYTGEAEFAAILSAMEAS